MNRITAKCVWLLSIVAVASTLAYSANGRALGRQRAPSRIVYAFPATGIIQGEMVRITVSNPEDVPPGPCRIYALDMQGNRVADSGDLLLPGNQFVAFNLSWSRMAVLPDEQTGRKNFRVVVVVSDQSGLPNDPARPGVELI